MLSSSSCFTLDKTFDMMDIRRKTSQPAITCSKLTIERQEQRCEICSKLIFTCSFFCCGWVVMRGSAALKWNICIDFLILIFLMKALFFPSFSFLRKIKCQFHSSIEVVFIDLKSIILAFQNGSLIQWSNCFPETIPQYLFLFVTR